MGLSLLYKVFRSTLDVTIYIIMKMIQMNTKLDAVNSFYLDNHHTESNGIRILLMLIPYLVLLMA